MNSFGNQRGVALVFALILSLAIMALLSGVMYFVTQSTAMSGAGKRYSTAQEAADGAVNAVKDAVNLTLWGEPVASVIDDSAYNCLANAILNNGVSCDLRFDLDGTLGQSFKGEVTIVRLYSVSMPGGRIEFARSASGVPGTAIYFRINAKVTGPNNATAENSALYRFAG